MPLPMSASFPALVCLPLEPPPTAQHHALPSATKVLRRAAEETSYYHRPDSAVAEAVDVDFGFESVGRTRAWVAAVLASDGAAVPALAVAAKPREGAG